MTDQPLRATDPTTPTSAPVNPDPQLQEATA
jgi:hypothetical protein